MIDLQRNQEIRDNREACGLNKYQHPKRLTLAEAKAMPKLHEGHFENIIQEYEWQGKQVRVSLSRMTVADDMPYNNQIVVCCAAPPAPGRADWLEIDEYEAK